MSEQQEPTMGISDVVVSSEDHGVELSPYKTALMIADRLGETAEGARKQIVTIVWALGRIQACALLEETVRIEEQGGMMLPDDSRRRTIGGVFFHLAYSIGVPKQGRTLQRTPATYAERRARRAKPAVPVARSGAPPLPPAPPFIWEDRIAVIHEIEAAKGIATTVKITLVGKMGKFAEKGDCIVGIMQHSGEKLPALPKGVPAPQAMTTNYVVYIGKRQWKNVAATVSDPEDVLIVEGFPQIDAKNNAISVFASNVTSKKIQAAKRPGPSKEGA